MIAKWEVAVFRGENRKFAESLVRSNSEIQLGHVSSSSGAAHSYYLGTTCDSGSALWALSSNLPITFFPS